jgi:hypothetical protein
VSVCDRQSIVPGNDDDLIKNGGKILDTHPPINLETIIKQVVFGMQGTPKKDETAPPK